MEWFDRRLDLNLSPRYSSLVLAGILLLAAALRLIYFNGLTFSDDVDYAGSLGEQLGPRTILWLAAAAVIAGAVWLSRSSLMTRASA